MTPTSDRWSWRMLGAAPHRLAFFLAMVVLVFSGFWWAAVQVDRASGVFGLAYQLSPTLVHATLMTFGFMPLFFAGFLFTAGPKWLAVPAPSARDIRVPLLLMASGWVLWPLAAHVSVSLAAGCLLLPLAGLSLITLRFWRSVLDSRVPDRIHAKGIATGLAVGCVALAGVFAAVIFDAPAVGSAMVQTGLWGFIIVVYVVVAHRMIPFFTSSALPMVKAWRPFWVLGVLLLVAGLEALAPWIDLATHARAWQGLRGALEVSAGAIVIWLAFAWGLVQSLKLRLVAMLHIGFSWLGIGLLIAGVSHAAQAFTGETWLPLAGLHAVTMGCLGSLMMAMVTRVSCGHGGRPLVADDVVWALFWLLQGATLFRVLGAWPTAAAVALMAAAAVTWAGAFTVWGIRYGSWYGRPRVDGRPG